jgi:hypothetical protein
MKKLVTAGIFLIVLVSALALFVSLALAAPTGGILVNGTTEHGTGTTSGTFTAQGGNVSQINVSGTMMTTKWAGFYGFISGGIQLADATSQVFYQWTITNFTNAVVYATNASVSNWDIRAINESMAPIGIRTAASDDYNHTFTLSAAFQSSSIGPIAGTPYVTTFQNGAAGQLRTYGLITNDNAVNIWAGVAIQNTTSFKTGQRVDYQILVPARTTGTQYNFYLELP